MIKTTIKTPENVSDLFRTARELDMQPSELMELFDDAFGQSWWDGVPRELTLNHVPGPVVPPGFEPLDEMVETYQGRRVDGERWNVISEWSTQTREFSLTFWTNDSDQFSADEAARYAEAIKELSAYISRVARLMAGTRVV